MYASLGGCYTLILSPRYWMKTPLTSKQRSLKFNLHHDVMNNGVVAKVELHTELAV